MNRASLTGQRLGVYELLTLVGAGGMGQVYRARDTRLLRDVAVKVLPPAFATDPDRLARFAREARLLASLNHPNIATIHDLEECEGTRAIVMEFVEGETLADRLRTGPLPIPESLAIARQVADGLDAAHDKGIIHRDLKPANIKITPDRTVKILDFGLAKTPEGHGLDDATSLTTVGDDPTRQGMIVGTAAYMSPEQARGLLIDKRTDIWAFGCVLYEMLTGRTAFQRSTLTDTLAVILERDPDWAALPPATPPTLHRILRRALAKDRQDRLRDIADVRFSLEDSAAEARAVEMPIAATRSRRLKLALGTGGLLAAAFAGWWTGRSAPAEPAVDQNPLANAQFTRVTDFPGSESDAAISVDGKFIVFVSDREGVPDVWLSQQGTGLFRNLTQGREKASNFVDLVRNVGISHDGTEIWLAGLFRERKLRLMPLFGGTPRVFLAGEAVNIAWSPDGSRLVYHLGETGDPIFVADRTGANAKQIFVSPLPGGHNHFPAWSPDGRWIYFVTGKVATQEMDVWRIAPSGGEPERLTNQNNHITYVTPIDSRTVLYLSPAADGSGPWLWALDVERKVTRRASHGLEKYISLSASGDGRRLVASVSNATSSLSSVPILDRPAEERDVKPFQVPTVRALAPRFGSGGLYYLSSLGRGDGLWRYQDNQALEIWKGTDGTLFQPAAISPDGRVAISLRRQGRIQLHVMSDDGTGLVALAETLDVRGSASWSPDGAWIVTGGIDAQGDGLFKVPVRGGAPVRLATGNTIDPVWSPDGSLIVYTGRVIAESRPLLALRPDGTVVELPDIRLRAEGQRHRFLPRGRGLVYMQGPAPSQDFWLLDLDTGQSRQLTRLGNNGAMRAFDITPDGKQIVFDRLRDNADLVQIDLP
jgi:serine/threonine protein kinase/Tol biopolymer transport system component